MPYKDFEEFRTAFLSKNPYNSDHSASGSNSRIVKEMLDDKMNRSFDLACKKREQYSDIPSRPYGRRTVTVLSCEAGRYYLKIFFMAILFIFN